MKPHAIGHTHRPLPTRHVAIADDGDSADDWGGAKKEEDGDDGGGDDARTKEKSSSSFTAAALKERGGGGGGHLSFSHLFLRNRCRHFFFILRFSPFAGFQSASLPLERRCQESVNATATPAEATRWQRFAVI